MGRLWNSNRRELWESRLRRTEMIRPGQRSIPRSPENLDRNNQRKKVGRYKQRNAQQHHGTLIVWCDRCSIEFGLAEKSDKRCIVGQKRATQVPYRALSGWCSRPGRYAWTSEAKKLNFHVLSTIFWGILR